MTAEARVKNLPEWNLIVDIPASSAYLLPQHKGQKDASATGFNQFASLELQSGARD